MRAGLVAVLIVSGFVGVSGFAGVASADEPAPGHVTVLPTTHIAGRRQVPGVVPVLSRARFRYETPELERHATDAIVESVTRAPF